MVVDIQPVLVRECLTQVSVSFVRIYLSQHPSDPGVMMKVRPVSQTVPSEKVDIRALA